MLTVIANVVYSLIVSVILTLLVFMFVTKVRGIDVNIIHGVCLGCIFLFIVVQSYLFFNAWDEKEIIQDYINTTTDIVNLGVTYANEDEMQDLVDSSAPLLNILGFDISQNGHLSYLDWEAFEDNYNKYMWKRVGLIFGIIALYVLIVFLFCKPDSGSSHSYEWNDYDISDWKNY